MRGRSSSVSIMKQNGGFHHQPTRAKSQPENARRTFSIAENKKQKTKMRLRNAYVYVAVITPTRILFRVLFVFLFIGWEFKIKGRFVRRFPQGAMLTQHKDR